MSNNHKYCPECGRLNEDSPIEYPYTCAFCNQQVHEKGHRCPEGDQWFTEHGGRNRK